MLPLPPQTLQAAVELSVRYLPGRCLPDKAIDLVDEACAAARIRAEQEQKPQPVLTQEDIARVGSTGQQGCLPNR